MPLLGYAWRRAAGRWRRLTGRWGPRVCWPLAALATLWSGAELAIWLSPYPLTDRARPPQSLRVLDRHGALLGERVSADGQRAQWVPLAEIAPAVVQATIAVEDRRFYAHRGVDLRAVTRATVHNIAAGRVVSGASTLTMQVVRLIEPHPKGLWPKLVEAVDARRLERAASKSAIIEQYLNRAPYGAGTIGVEAASQRYFGRPASQLDLPQAALLAGLPQSPSRLDPLKFPDRARARRATVLTRMRDGGIISPAAFDRAQAAPLGLVVTPRPRAMHFTDALLARHPDRLAAGGAVRTTLDWPLQRDLDALVLDHVETLRPRGLTNAAVVVLDNADCAVRAMVGSADYWRPPHGAVNGAMAPRQPGSTLKPFAYALAFEQGDSPATVVADVPMWFDGADGRFRPRNYTGRFYGPVMMGEALARSLNIAAIRVAARVGPAALLDRLRAAGLAHLDRDVAHYGLGLVLGNGEATLVELAQAYAGLARAGHGCRARLLPGATDATVEAPAPLFAPHVAALITDILADDRLRMLAFGPDNALMLGFPMAIKSGTSESWRDSWVIGYTDHVTVAVWAGDFDGRPMQALSGVTGAGPLFRRVAHRVVGHRDGPGVMGPGDHPTDRPGRRAEAAAARAGGPQLHTVDVCLISGRAPTDACPAGRRVRTALTAGTPSAAVLEPDTWMRPVTIDTRNGLRAGPGCPAAHVEQPVFAHLPPVYAEWQATALDHPPPPTRYSPLCPAGPTDEAAALRVTHPVGGDIFVLDPGAGGSHQRVALQAEADPPPVTVEWLIDGAPVARATWPYTASWALARGQHTVELVADGARSPPITFEVR